MLNITETAQTHIERILSENNEKYMRVGISGGGCSGFSYTFDFAERVEDDDFTFDKVVVDSLSMQYINGATLDFVEDLMGYGFEVQNPNAVTKCGCGSSFGI